VQIYNFFAKKILLVQISDFLTKKIEKTIFFGSKNREKNYPGWDFLFFG